MSAALAFHFVVIPAKAGTQRHSAGLKSLGSGSPLRGVRNDED
jgi:hypothetical protein